MEEVQKYLYVTFGGKNRDSYRILQSIDETKLTIADLKRQVALLDAKIKKLKDATDKCDDDSTKQINLTQISSYNISRDKLLNEMANIQQKLARLEENVTNDKINGAFETMATGLVAANTIAQMTKPAEVTREFSSNYKENSKVNDEGFFGRMQTFELPEKDVQLEIDDVIQATSNISLNLPSIPLTVPGNMSAAVNVPTEPVPQQRQKTAVKNFPRFVPFKTSAVSTPQLKPVVPVKLPDIDAMLLADDDDSDAQKEVINKKTLVKE